MIGSKELALLLAVCSLIIVLIGATGDEISSEPNVQQRQYMECNSISISNGCEETRNEDIEQCKNCCKRFKMEYGSDNNCYCIDDPEGPKLPPDPDFGLGTE